MQNDSADARGSGAMRTGNNYGVEKLRYALLRRGRARVDERQLFNLHIRRDDKISVKKNSVAIGDIKIEGVAYKQLIDIEIFETIGQHGTCQILLMVDEKLDAKTILNWNKTQIKVKADKDIIFCGIISQCRLENRIGTNYLNVTVKSLSCKLETARKSMTFQNAKKKFSDILSIVEKEYKLDPFTEVTSRVVANVQLVQSDDKNGIVVLSAPDNYIELFDFDSEDNELDISFTRENTNIDPKNVNITVYTTDLTKVRNTGAASVCLDSLDTDVLTVENSGVGSFKLHKVLADQVSIRCSGVGDISIDGETQEAELNCSGVGNIHAKDLKSNRVKANVSGVGGISCYASDDIDGNVTGVGSLKYAGHPKQKNLNKPFTGGISEI